jgi:CRP-like cAMP-binding protein
LSQTILDILVSTELFRGMDQSVLREIETQLQLLHLSGGETLLRQGERGDCLYVLIYGRLRVFVEDPNGAELVVGEVAPGEIVGEMAVLSNEPRSATVRAIRDSELVMFSKEVFDRLLEKYPQAMMQITRQIVDRLQRRNSWHRFINLVTIAVVPRRRGCPTLPVRQSSR